MALVQPSLILPISAIIPGQPSIIKFNFGVGNTSIIQSTKISIYSNPSDTIPKATSIYNSTTNTHEISASVTNTLETQKQYYMSIQTYTGINASGTSSAESNKVLFWALNPSTLNITAPLTDVTITVNTLYVEATYNTGITDPALTVDNKLSYYSFQLLKDGSVIYSSGNIIGEGTKLTDNTYNITYTFNGLTNGNYILKVTGISNQNMVVTAERSIIVDTQIISFKTATVVNNICEGYISVECNITNIDGKTNGITHDEDGWLQLNDLPSGIKGYITWDNGYNFPSVVSGINTFSNWTLQLWGFNFKTAPDVSPYGGTPIPRTLSTNTNYLIQLRNLSVEGDVTTGEINIYIVYDTDTNHVRADLYVYPYASEDSYSISKYVPSNTISLPTQGASLTVADNLTLWLRSLNGEYDIQLRNITKNEPPI
ncbi:MAG: hypothetical protein PHN69_07660 [Candidatus Pacebacteria bacterium]|nr:hypothetical protein [Candidatus Paceibacterota bacterium]